MEKNEGKVKIEQVWFVIQLISYQKLKKPNILKEERWRKLEDNKDIGPQQYQISTTCRGKMKEEKWPPNDYQHESMHLAKKKRR